jgi:Predicted ATPase (AAA+ superfamily)
VDSLFLNPDVDLYMTGSNAYLLSGELATLLSGRYITIEMLPLSFKEYVEALGKCNLTLSEKYRQYVERSSFPYVMNFGNNKEEVLDYLAGIYSTIVLKDVVSRFKITDTKMLESVVRFIFDSIGSPLSSKRIADSLTSAGRKIDVKTVEKYITALQESFIVYEAKRYDVKGKEYLKLLEKYYAVDIGLRFLLLGQRANDVGHILENVVYLELVRRGYMVFVGKIDDAEIDFVAQNHEGNTYIQVSATVRDDKTLQRELKPLLAVKDNYPKLLLTLDDDPDADYNGVKKTNALEWLLFR